MSTSKSAYDYSAKGTFTMGIVGFAAVMLIAVACIQILQGIAALGGDDLLVIGEKYTFAFSVTTWGWIHVILGIIGIGIGAALLKDMTVGYLAGIALAFVSTVAEFAFLPYYPFWSLLVISFNILVIWAICSRMAHQD